MNKLKKFGVFWAIILIGWGCFSGCQSVKSNEKRLNTIAVWDLDNLNPAELEEFQLGELLAGQVMEVFEESGRWIVVERKELILALEEQHLGSSDLISDDTRLRIGRLLGAQSMAFGTYMKYLENLQINLRVVDVETGQIIQAAQKIAPFTSVGDALEMTKQAALELQK